MLLFKKIKFKMGLGKKIRILFGINTSEDLFDSAFLKVKNTYGLLKVADLGCGEGKYIYSSTYKENIKTCDLIDKYVKPSDEILKDPRYQYKQTDVESYLNNTESNSLNLILAKDILEHISQEDSQRILDECYRILTKDGMLLIQMPNGSSPFGLRNFNNDLTHIQFLGHTALKDLCEKSSFEKVKVYPVAEISRGKFALLSTIVQKNILEPIIENVFSSSIGHCGKFFWTPNIMAKLNK